MSSSRRFDEGEEAFLITLSAQLAGVIASAEATGAIAGISPSGQKFQTPFLPASWRFRRGDYCQMVVVFPKANLYQVPIRQARDLNREIGVFNDALNKVRQDMQTSMSVWQGKLQRKSGSFLMSIFTCSMTMRWAKRYWNGFRPDIGPRAHSLRWLWSIFSFEMMPDDYLRERAVDIKEPLQPGSVLSAARRAGTHGVF